MQFIIFILPPIIIGITAYWVAKLILDDVEAKRKIEFDKLHQELKKTNATISALANRIKILENQNKSSSPFGRKW